MSEARAAILANIRRGLQRGVLDEQRQEGLRARLREHPRNLIPERSRLPRAEQRQLFRDMALEASASLAEVAGWDRVPAAVAAFLGEHDLPARVVLAADERLIGQGWSEAGLDGDVRVARNGDTAAVSPAFAAIAETGTLMLCSGPQSPTTNNFLPDNHVVVLEADRIVGAYEEAWSMLREAYAEIPRTVNMITGPSRSADIEQKLQMGAHGPVRLHILLVG